jgi:hypothetical protein
MITLSTNSLLPVCFLALVGIRTLALGAETSALWGERGEKWDAKGRLPDFSYAGYHQGEKPIPDVVQIANVRDFGAIGDGISDDTKAIQAAIDATKNGAVFVPAGRYKITDFIRIDKSNLVLRGAGPGQTIFWFPRGLDEIHPKVGRTSTGDPASGYSFNGAFVTMQGSYGAKPLAKIVKTARRGDNAVEVDQTAGLKVGQNVLMTAQEDAIQSLKTYLYNGDPGDIAKGKPEAAKMLLRIVAVRGKRVEFNRPLRFETRAAWKPEIRTFLPTVTESGIENIGFEFPATRYRGHFNENGANAIELRQVYNCWVRNVSVNNGDMGINVVASGNTLDGIVFTADAGRGLLSEGIVEWTGHHAIQCKDAEDNLVTRFDLQASYCHDLSVEHAAGNVFSKGKGSNLNLDHHKDTPYENLFTDIDCGGGTRVWSSGGGASLGRSSASWGTFWNIRANRIFRLPRAVWGPKLLNFVGVNAEVPPVTEPREFWVENIAPSQLHPRDLHQSQLERRLGTARLAARQSPPYILLKVDDLTSVGAGVHPRWQKFVDFCRERKIPAGIGIICNSLEPDNPGYISWIKQQQATGLFEFWNHGLDHKKWEEGGQVMQEFKGPSYQQQKEHYRRSQELAHQKLGAPFATFGAPFNATDANTARVISEDPNTQIWLYGDVKSPAGKLVLDRINTVNIENPTAVPNFDKFVAGYNKNPQRSYFVIQGHPAGWDDARFEQFRQIVDFLCAEKAIFVTPLQYAKVAAQPK